MTQRRLLLLRHAKSSWARAELADHDRPLNDRGRRDAPAVGKLLRALEIVPDAVLVSTALRAQQTADAVLAAAGIGMEDGARRDERRLYLADPDAWIDLLRDVPAGATTVLGVGHNPGIEDLASALSGIPVRMPTAALAVLDLPAGRWSGLTLRARGRLAWFWTPKGGRGAPERR